MLARQLLNSTVDPDRDQRTMAMNPVANAVELIVDARLTGRLVSGGRSERLRYRRGGLSRRRREPFLDEGRLELGRRGMQGPHRRGRGAARLPGLLQEPRRVSAAGLLAA